MSDKYRSLYAIQWPIEWSPEECDHMNKVFDDAAGPFDVVQEAAAIARGLTDNEKFWSLIAINDARGHRAIGQGTFFAYLEDQIMHALLDDNSGPRIPRFLAFCHRAERLRLSPRGRTIEIAGHAWKSDDGAWREVPIPPPYEVDPTGEDL